jgi:hypothetical protein
LLSRSFAARTTRSRRTQFLWRLRKFSAASPPDEARFTGAALHLPLEAFQGRVIILKRQFSRRFLCRKTFRTKRRSSSILDSQGSAVCREIGRAFGTNVIRMSFPADTFPCGSQPSAGIAVSFAAIYVTMMEQRDVE